MSEKSVLIIEDDENIGNLFALVADSIQCKVERLTTGKDAVKRLSRTPIPNIVLLDLHLPGVGGAKILERLRKTPGWEKVPVIIVTAYLHAGKQLEALAEKKGLKYDGIYYKNEFNIDILHALIVQHL